MDAANHGAAVTEHTFKTDRHTTGYLQAGPSDGPLIIFCHGWPELSRSWRHQLPVFGGLGFRAVAPDMRGYGRSSVYGTQAAYRLELIVADMIELIDGLGYERAIWVGHDWGSPVVWSVASHHADRVRAVASLCVPYLPRGFVLDELIPRVDRRIYPEDEFPAGQWEYQLFYEENFDAARSTFDSDIGGVVRALFRAGRPESIDQPAPTAYTRRDGGWFRGGPVPALRQDYGVLSDADHAVYTAALSRNGFFGPDSWYMHHQANGEYARSAPNDGALAMPVLFLHGNYDQTCETVRSQLADPMREACSDLTEAIVDSGHWMAQEQPAAVNAALAGWLATSVGDVWPGPRPVT